MNPPTERQVELLRLVAAGVTTYRDLRSALGVPFCPECGRKQPP